MSSVPPVHLAIMQPPGYVHSLGFVDQARYMRYQFRRLGAQVSLAKNRLREDAINIVFGAHLGFPVEWKQRHTCLFFNLEQLGTGGAAVSAAYLRLLRTSAVIDYDPGNVGSYCDDPDDVPLVRFGHAAYLDDGDGIALEARPIDLLFFGSMNDRRRAFIADVEASGVQVTVFDHPLYGPERDQFIRQAKAVLNCSFYETSRFEQARVSHCLSLGTPVISEQHVASAPPPAFESAVCWLPAGAARDYFDLHFGSETFFEDARARLAEFCKADPVDDYAELLAFAVGVHQGYCQQRDSEPWRPARINLGSGKDYKAGWLNLDVLDRAEPDLVLDLGQAIRWPVTRQTRYGGVVHLEPGSVEQVYANNVLEHVPDLPMLMSNVLALLSVGGEFEIEVPYEHAPTAWQDPTHLRAMNENSWLYYTEWFWYLGWFEHRFELVRSLWLDLKLQPCAQASAAFMKVTLRKVETTLRERTTARVMQADFGGIDDDEPEPPADIPMSQADGPALVAMQPVTLDC